MAETTRKFPAAGMGVRLKNPLVDGAVTLRMPTDEEYAALRRRLEQAEGRRDEELALSDGLFQELHVEGGSSVDPDGADYLLGRLLQFEPLAAKVDGETFLVRAAVLAGLIVSFRFRLPSVRRLREEPGSLTLPLGVKLFDEFVASTEGYAGAVPNYHKHAAAVLLREGLFQSAAEVETVDFFDLTAPTTGEAQPAA